METLRINKEEKATDSQGRALGPWMSSPKPRLKETILGYLVVAMDPDCNPQLLIIKLIFKNLFIYFNWRLITLQYCGGFAIHRHEPARVHVCPHPEPLSHLPPHPIPRLFQSTGFHCPASCIKLVLVISFTCGNIHVSILLSQIIPRSPSPTESKSLFFISVSLLLSCVEGCCFKTLHLTTASTSQIVWKLEKEKVWLKPEQTHLEKLQAEHIFQI